MSYPTFLNRVEGDVRREREAQDAKWGEQNHPNGTGGEFYARRADSARRACQMAAKDPDVGPRWSLILDEEVSEALAEEDLAALYAELIQVAATAQAWAEAIGRQTR